MPLPYTMVCFDISGMCNAVCPWCDCGARKRGLLPSERKPDTATRPFTDAALAEDILSYLLERKFISQKRSIALYNWGEPLLNPHLEQILLVARRLSLNAIISTNGSGALNFNDSEATQCLSDVIFSIPGYSQESYDAAHGFNAAATRRNIEANMEYLKSAGFAGKAYFKMHVYRTNFEEIPLVRDFAAQLGGEFSPVIAHPNSMDYYFSDAIGAEIHERMLNELFFVPLEEARAYRPQGYQCPQWSYLTLSWNGKMNLCCCNSPRDDELVFIKDIDPDESLRMRMTHPTCKMCVESGYDFFAHEQPKILRAMVAEGKMPETILECLSSDESHSSRWEKRKREIREKGILSFLKRRLLPR